LQDIAFIEQMLIGDLWLSSFFPQNIIMTGALRIAHPQHRT